MAGSGLEVVTVTIRGPLTRADMPGLCARTCALLESSGAATLLCEVTGLAADAVTVDALARLALAARRRACRVRLCGASADLLALVALMGLADALGDEPTSRAAGERRTGGR